MNHSGLVFLNKRPSLNFELLFISFLFLIFFRTGIALRVSGPFDEACYVARAQQIVGLESAGCEGKSHFSGIAILWIPAALIGRGVASFFHVNPSDWIAAFCGLSSFLFWVGTWRAIQEIFRFFKITVPVWMPFLVLLNCPVFYYAFARTLLAHSGEVFIAFCYVLSVIRRQLVISTILLLLLFLIRPNNWGAFLFLFSQIITTYKTSDITDRRKTVLVGISMLLIVLLFFGTLIKFGVVSGYHGTFLIPLLLNWQPRSIVEFFLRSDHGVLWNQFVWTLVLAFSILRFNLLSDLQIGALFWMLCSILSAVFWPTYGSSFGYRYILGAYAPAFFICLEFIRRRNLLTLPAKRLLTLMLLIGAFWSLNLYWVSTAPSPLWPWTDPFLTQLSPPYVILSNWINHTKAMIQMISFSSISQIFYSFSEKEIFLSFDGTRIPYFFEGRLKQFSLVITVSFFVIFIFTAFNSVIFLIKNRKQS
jgi:hypothetical protein